MQNKNLYHNTAQFYDISFSVLNSDDDIDFYCNFILPSSSILEIGCGTGRVLLELIKHNHYVCGIDNSFNMLFYLKNKFDNLPNRTTHLLKIVQSDFKRFNLHEKFSYIIFPFRGFQLLTNKNQIFSCLESLKLHMAFDSVLIIDLFNPDLSRFKNWINYKNKDFSCNFDNSENILERWTVGKNHDISNQTFSFYYEFILSEKNVISKFKDDFELAYFFPEQVENIFLSAGFRIIEKLHHWTGKSIEKKNLIYILTLNN